MSRPTIEELRQRETDRLAGLCKSRLDMDGFWRRTEPSEYGTWGVMTKMDEPIERAQNAGDLRYIRSLARDMGFDV